VDINVLFDSEKLKTESSTEKKTMSGTLKRPIEQYDVENEANREQRRAFLNRIRFTRGLSLVFVLLVSVFFLGLILTIIGAVYLESDDSDLSESDSKPNLLSVSTFCFNND